MREQLLLDLPHRQVVFTIPKMLRIFFKYKRYLQSSLCRCGVQALLKYLKVVTEKELTPGVIAVIQTSGERINFSISLLASLRIFLSFIASSLAFSQRTVLRGAGVKLPGLLTFLACPDLLSFLSTLSSPPSVSRKCRWG